MRGWPALSRCACISSRVSFSVPPPPVNCCPTEMILRWGRGVFRVTSCKNESLCKCHYKRKVSFECSWINALTRAFTSGNSEFLRPYVWQRSEAVYHTCAPFVFARISPHPPSYLGSLFGVSDLETATVVMTDRAREYGQSIHHKAINQP